MASFGINPFFLFENLLETTGATITVSPGTAAGFPVENLSDWRCNPADAWRSSSTATTEITLTLPTAGTADSVVVAGQNSTANGGAGVIVQYSPSGDWINDSYMFLSLDATNVPDSSPLVAYAAATTARYWKIIFLGGAVAPQASIVTLGRQLRLPTLPPGLDCNALEYDMDTPRNETGMFLGSNLRNVKKQFVLNVPSPGYTDAAFFKTPVPDFDNEFLAHAKSRPFWFVWNADDLPQQTYMCRVVKGVTSPFDGIFSRRTLALTMQCWVPR